jgi:NTE family protein
MDAPRRGQAYRGRNGLHSPWFQAGAGRDGVHLPANQTILLVNMGRTTMVRAGLAFIFLLAASGCATLPDAPVNTRLAAPIAAPPIDLGVDGEAIALAFSGGGARAASFSYGALLGLKEMTGADGRRLVDRVSLVTAVSGGAITAAYYGQHGPDDLDGFRARALDKDWAGHLHSFAWPATWMGILGGGANGPDRLANWLDAELFHGARISDLKHNPVIINATELYTGAPFAFAAPYFQAICSDLPSVRLADAVAASMAVPLAFRPVVVESHGADCPDPLPGWVARARTDHYAPILLRETARAFEAYRDPAQMRFLHLADGGVVDNFGLSSLITMRQAAATPTAPFSERDAVKLTRLSFLVVNAGLSPSGAWSRDPKGPTGLDVVDAALSDSINGNKRMAYLAFGGMLQEWKRDLAAWRCALPADRARALGAGPGWKCDALEFRLDMISFADLPKDQYERLGAVPTAVSLPKATIDDLIAAGAWAVKQNGSMRDLGNKARSSR